MIGASERSQQRCSFKDNGYKRINDLAGKAINQTASEFDLMEFQRLLKQWDLDMENNIFTQVIDNPNPFN